MSHSNPTKYHLLTVKDLQGILGLSRSSVYRFIEREGFPKPVVLGPADSRGASIRWRSDEIEAYLDTLPRGKSLEG